MSAEPTRCPKCNGAMVQGFVVEIDGANRKVNTWVEGAPEKSFWSMVESQSAKVAKEKCVPVGTFRCSGCGFLESYARPEFAPQ